MGKWLIWSQLFQSPSSYEVEDKGIRSYGEQEEKIPSIEAMVSETGPEREQEGRKIRQRIDY